ncbi:MAG: arsenate reductase (glutaredoxin) [Acidobacteria bacterium]|nr:arsenate reductase (glutaredoxin) [Acidobacteriota bacterium]
MAITIFHNPRCSKSRQTLTLIQERGFTPTIIHYLEEPPSRQQLDQILTKLACQPTEIIRWGEDLAKELGITRNDTRTRAEWIELMVAHPKLIERPIVVSGDKARVGRPPERVLEILP